MNSVDASSNKSLFDTTEQIKCIVDAGIDYFIEISGEKYEDPRMLGENSPDDNPATSTPSRESFFPEVVQTIR